MKSFSLPFIILLSLSVSQAQVYPNYLLKLWCERPDHMYPRSPLERSAAEFETSVQKRLESIIYRCSSLRAPLSVKSVDDSRLWKMNQLSYRRGSLSPVERKRYENNITSILDLFERELNKIEDQQKSQWRRDNPIAARIEDAELAVADAEAAASYAQQQAEEMEMNARQAEQNARNAEARARDAEQRARDAESRSRALQSDW